MVFHFIVIIIVLTDVVIIITNVIFIMTIITSVGVVTATLLYSSICPFSRYYYHHCYHRLSLFHCHVHHHYCKTSYRWYEVKTPELELANWNLELRSRSWTLELELDLIFVPYVVNDLYPCYFAGFALSVFNVPMPRQVALCSTNNTETESIVDVVNSWLIQT